MIHLKLPRSCRGRALPACAWKPSTLAAGRQAGPLLTAWHAKSGGCGSDAVPWTHHQPVWRWLLHADSRRVLRSREACVGGAGQQYKADDARHYREPAVQG